MDDNYINLMDKQPVSHVIQNSQNRAMGIVDQHVIKKINDQNQMQLSDLKTNDDNCAFTLTENNDWLIFEFMRKERLSAIKGKLYYDDDNQEIFIECQYLDQKQQWITCFHSSFRDIMEQKIFPTLKAYGLRFRKMKKTYIPLKFINLNIFAKAGRPYVMQENPFENAYLIHNKYEIVNLMNPQTFYKKIDNLLVAYKRPVVTKLNDVSAYDNEEITGNQNQDIHQYCTSPPIWLTYQFDRKYKLSKIEIQLYKKDRRKFDYQIEMMNKNKNWIQVDAGRSGYKPLEVEFVNLFPSYGIRIKGKSTISCPYGILVVSMKILAQRGNPRIIQG